GTRTRRPSHTGAPSSVDSWEAREREPPAPSRYRRSRDLRARRAAQWSRSRTLETLDPQDTTAEVDTGCIKSYLWIGATLSKPDIEIDQDLYFISMAARMLGMHPQTLRKYERLGLVQPTRSIGSMRLYSRGELERLKLIKRLVDDAGINLAGVQRLLSIAEVVQRLRPLVRDDSISARDTRRRLVQELDELSRMLGFD